MKGRILPCLVGALAWISALLPVALQAQSSQSQRGVVSLNKARISYEVVGEGDPVVVVHGGPGLDHTYLRPGLDILAGSHSLVYYDQRGTGRSEAVLDAESITLDTFVEDIESLRKTLGRDRLTLLGHSFGSLLVLGYALAHPDRTRGLILMAPVEPGTRWRSSVASGSPRAIRHGIRPR